MILDAIKYEVGLAYNYLGWLGYFNKNNGRLLPYYPVKKLRGYEVNAGGSIFLQQVLEDIIELKPPKITKYLSADLNCLSSIADDLIDHDGEDLERFRAIIEDPSIDVPEEWKLVKFLAEHVQNVMGDNYNEMKAILPSSMESLKMELDAKTKPNSSNSTVVTNIMKDFNLFLVNPYNGTIVAIFSGTSCIAIPRATTIPNTGDNAKPTPIANPSGILCKAIPITSMVTLLLMDGFSFFINSGFICGSILSTNRIIIIPKIKDDVIKRGEDIFKPSGIN